MNKFFVDVNWLFNNLSYDMVILDIPYGLNEYVKDTDNEKREYCNKHIPGAILIEKNELEAKENDLNLYDASTLEKVFLSKGIDANTLTVIYSDGIIAACRVALAAYWIGVKNIKILLGGIASWEKAGYPISNVSTTPQPKENFGVNTPARQDILFSTPKDIITEQENNPNFVLANIRSWEEFVGNQSGYPYLQKAGSPDKSVYAEASTNRVNVEKLIDEDGNFGNIPDILEKWESWGITPDKKVAFMCGAGWRAATAFFLTRELGWTDTSVYDGGWYQWLKFYEQDPKTYKIQIGNPQG